MKHLSFLVLLIIISMRTNAQNTLQREIDAFTSSTGANITIDKATGSINFIRFPIDNALRLDGATPTQKALTFISRYAGLFNNNSISSHSVKEMKRDNYGLDHVTLQQLYDRIPVFDGVLKFHFNKEGGLTSVNGNYVVMEKINVAPSISADDATQEALRLVSEQKAGQFTAPLKVIKNTLFIFQKGLAQGFKGPLHLVYEIEVRNEADVREFLFIDAHSRKLVEQFTGMHSIDRKLYETSVSDPNLKWQESDGIGGAKYNGLDQWQKSEIDAAGHVYNLMKNAFGFNSYDNAGAAMVSVHNKPNIICPNANWNGVSANYCPNIASDDIVAHEWAHAYTQNTSGLIYRWQAGALNEAYSDIWGEIVDQLNGYFDNGESNTPRNACASSHKWQVGEQSSAFGGAIRDMWDPTCKGQPGKVSDPQYYCSLQDQGGVHTNSGIINHAFALLVDGGTYNGQNISGLGLTKAAHIFWQAQSSHIVSTTDFSSLADLLEASLLELIGIDLPKLSTDNTSGLSGIKIAASDINQLKQAILAVELRKEADCGLHPNYQPLFKPVSNCKGALPGNAIFYETFENGLGSWMVSNAGYFPEWVSRDWKIDLTPPDGRTGKVVFAEDFSGGNCIDNNQKGTMSITSPLISVPVGQTGPFFMSFDHYLSLQSEYDGGNVKYKIGADQWKLIPKSAFVANGYNSTMWNDNPLNSEDCFTGSDGGSFTTHWGQSQINLSALGLAAGQTIQFRWDLATDGCVGWDGWYMDDVRVYSCTTPTVQFVTTNTTVNEGEANLSSGSPNACLSYIEKKLTIKINQAPSQPVTVTLNPSQGSAKMGNNADYTITPNSFTLQAGTLSKDILIRIYNDSNVEDTETLTLSYSLSSPAGGNASPELFNQQHRITIIDNELLPDINARQLIDAHFNTGMPEGWSVIDGGDFPETWDVVDYKNEQKIDPTGTPYLYTNSSWGFQIPDLQDRIVETMPFNSLKAQSLHISFIEFYFPTTGIKDFVESATVDVWDGTAWHTLLTQNQTTGMSGSDWALPATRNIPIPLAYRNPAMKVRFRYFADWNGWWAIDNVKVTATYNNNIKTTLSQSPDSQYLGPNSTVFFHDPTSGDLIAKVKNLTDHDYGCTSVEIDRAGVDKTAWIGTHKITNKTFKVTPTNNNANGNYEITLYYKASELPTFNGNAIKSMGKSEGSILQATAANSVTAPVALTMINADFAYSATFNGSFSGFGLSDAPSGQALPVTLVRFEGENTDGGNALHWETSSEINHDHFVIERSTDGKEFVAIASKAGMGNSIGSNTYSFTDRNFQGTLNYYRLKQVDKDLTFAYSRVIAIKSTKSAKQRHFPNPVQSVLTLEIPEMKAQTCQLNVVNAAGKIVMTDDHVEFKQGKISVNMAKLPAGIYQVIVLSISGRYQYAVAKAP